MIKIINSFLGDIFKIDLNLEIPPNGYIIILSTSTPNSFAVKKCPSSWIIIKRLITIKGTKEAVKIDIRANIYTNLSISKYLNIVFII